MISSSSLQFGAIRIKNLTPENERKIRRWEQAELSKTEHPPESGWGTLVTNGQAFGSADAFVKSMDTSVLGKMDQGEVRAQIENPQAVKLVFIGHREDTEPVALGCYKMAFQEAGTTLQAEETPD
jgi:hypothetical protein